MKKCILFTVLMILCLIFNISCSKGKGELDLEEGMYSITYRTEIPGMPMPMPPITLNQCITQKNPVPEQSSGSDECTITRMNTSSDTVTWTMECKQRGSYLKATGTMTFQGDKLEGKTQMEMETKSGRDTVTTYMEGKRTGPCS